MSNRSPIARALLVGSLVSVGSLLSADTVYLKNGNWIDGMVQPRKEGDSILLIIGDLGRVEIQLEDVYEIEKNSRTGGSTPLPQDKQPESLEDSLVSPQDLSGLGDQGAARDDTGDGGDEEMELRAGAADTPGVESETETIDPELKARIEKLVSDLTRQKSKYRVRAERHLKVVGPAAIPYLLPLTKHKSDLVRVSTFRLFHSFGDERVIDSAIGALLDSNEHVRDFAHRTLQRITQEDFNYKPLASPRRREYAHKKWRKWWNEEKESLEDLARDVRDVDANGESVAP